MKIDGGYHCGYIAYEAEADPAKARTFLLAPHMSAFGGKADIQFALTDVWLWPCAQGAYAVPSSVQLR